MRKKGRAPSKAVEAFSVHSNFENLTQVHNAGSTIRSIDGIKVLSAMWIIIGHRKDFMNEPFPHRRHQNNWLEELVFDFFSSYLYCVDTFFACSAILVTQSLLRSFDKWVLQYFVAWSNFWLPSTPGDSLTFSKRTPTDSCDSFPLLLFWWCSSAALCHDWWSMDLCLASYRIKLVFARLGDGLVCCSSRITLTLETTWVRAKVCADLTFYGMHWRWFEPDLKLNY